MSEQNILNPAAGAELSPDYGYLERPLGVEIANFMPRFGRPFARMLSGGGRQFVLAWEGRQDSTKDLLQQWERQYAQDFFSYQDVIKARYYSGRFAGPLEFSPVGNNRWNIRGVFEEMAELALFAYPTNWTRDAIFIEERDGFGDDLVKLVGTWDRRTKNYCLRSEEIDNAAWGTKNQCTVAANTQTDPLGGSTADRITPDVAATNAFVAQSVTVPSLKGKKFTFSIWLKAASGTPSINIGIGNQSDVSRASQAAALSTSWQRFSVTATMNDADTGIRPAIGGGNSFIEADGPVDAWGGQLEYGSAASTYVQTTSAAVELTASLAHFEEHAGFAWWNAGTSTTDAAEWQYFGYGFRLWAPKGPDQGILAVSIDGGTETLVDLYNAAMVVSAAVHTDASRKLGLHRVKVRSTNTKNASSSANSILADAIEVMQ